MANGICWSVAPILFRKKGKDLSETNKSSDSSKKLKEVNGFPEHNSCSVAGNFITMTELREKILRFRDLIDLPPCVSSASVNELVIGTVKDLHNLYPDTIPSISMSEMEGTPIHQALVSLCNALKSIGDMWMNNNDWMITSKNDTYDKIANNKLEQLALAILDDMIKVARERLFDMMEEDDQMKDYSPGARAFGRSLSESYSDNRTPLSCSPATPTSVLPEMTNHFNKVGEFEKSSYSPPLLLPFRVQAIGKLNPIDVKRLSFHMFPHVAAQDSNLLKQMNMTAEELKPEKEANKDSEVTAADSIKVTKDCRKMGDTPKILMTNLDKITSHEGRNQIGNPNIQPVPSPGTLGGGAIDMLLEPHSLPNLQPSVVAVKAPPPPPTIASSNAVVSPPLQPPPPMPSPAAVESPQPASMQSSNKVQSPVPAPPKLPPNAIAGPPPQPFMESGNPTMPPPPLPPPVTSRNIAPPPPMSSRNIVTPPPPPPPMPSGNTATPPLPPMMSSNGPVPSQPPPMPPTKGGAPPPPPPLGGAKSLRPKKAATKLKRSSQMGNLYRLLKGKVEGSSLDGKLSQGGRTSKIGASTSGKQGMADALAEMTKRSAYFQQIEEDVKNHSKSIMEVKAAINSFQTTDMAELLKFHKYVESHLEKLTDESQVLARFEGFPTKKLEALRMAAALYSKLYVMINNLQNWKIEAPLGQLIEKVENYFNKIKGELDALERTKDEESKKFKSQKIQFDFSILLRIKELMVDVSSGCMELALKESREAKAKEKAEVRSKTEGQKKGSAKMLWKAFQFAFRVYTFAGGHDDRADKLTRELAHEIESDPHH
ncbi:hypothetical protein F0562_014082 [Nyssa sinensis]|uniref:Uncharacterized protein n=1 Tax=Nyssa sinensis TaxID=561372 RepID=A0A5J4ZQ49_9ASTE|nr:hypothetical protein F0562_014082 [Nyssa sinensis]